MTIGFQGFSPSTLTFLHQVRQEDSKEWFDAHRGDYEEHLLKPFRALVSELQSTMLQIDDLFETAPAVGKTLSRIHRDTRFSHDKARYRSNMWFTFKRTHKDWLDAPVYFFELTPQAWHYGLGYYSASRQTMELFRQSLHDSPDAFLEVAACLGDEFRVEGESYKRPLVPDQPAALAHWYNRKSFAAVNTRHDMEATFGSDLAAILSMGFVRLEPLYRYLIKIEMLKRSAEPETAGPALLVPDWLER